MARPTLFNDPATETIRVRVTPDQKRDLQRVAEVNQTDLSGVIREAVDEYVADCLDASRFVGQNTSTVRE